MNAQEYAEIEELLKSSSDEEVLEVTKKDVENCSICLMEMWRKKRARAKPCGHRFHKSCIDRWISIRGLSCPYCRADVVYVQTGS
jgi:hypothetical protein